MEGILQEGSRVLCRVASEGLNSRRQMLNAAVSFPASYQISCFPPCRSLLRMSLSLSSPPFAGSFPSSLAPTLPPPVRRLPLCLLLPLLHTQAWSRPLLPSCWPRQRWLYSREASNLQPRPSRLHRWVSMENPRHAFRGRTRAISDYAVVCLRFFLFLLSLLLVCYFWLCSCEQFSCQRRNFSTQACTHAH